MYNRFWTIILLMALIGQMPLGVLLKPIESNSPQWVVCLLEDDLVILIIYQASRPMPRPCSRRRHRKRRKKAHQYPSPLVDEKREKQDAQSKKAQGSEVKSVHEPERWGLSSELSQKLPENLQHFWERYHQDGCFKTKTRNTGEYAHHYLSALLRMENKRNYTNIGQAAKISGENIQHFMSKSPWAAEASLKKVRHDIRTTPGLEEGGILLLDESANEKAGDTSAGAGRQYNGRLGKKEMSQIGVFLAYANLTCPNRPLWTWVDGELYFQEEWFTPEREEKRKKVGVPEERKFETKIELGWKMIQRVKAEGLSFEAIAFDDLYGRSQWLRDKVNGAELIYMADVPCNTQVYLEKPVLGVPKRKPGGRGPAPSRLQVLNNLKSVAVHKVRRRDDTIWKRVRVRPIERGELNDPFTARRVWTLREGESEPVAEWLLIRQESDKRFSYALSNAPVDTSLKRLAWFKCLRYFVERANQDAKSDIGWDELQAWKYRGWQHHLALVILAAWFIAQVKWQWCREFTRDPSLAQQFELEVLPTLSMANIRLLLRAAMPLPQPTPKEAVALVIGHLVNRTRSRKSRLKRQRSTHSATAPP